MTFYFKFSCYSLKKDTRVYFCSPQKLVRLFPLKEVKPSPDRLMIKFLTFDNLFSPLQHFLLIHVEWRRLPHFPAKMTLVRARSRCRPGLRI